MDLKEITAKRIAYLVDDLKLTEKKEVFYNETVLPFVTQAQIFYPKLKLDAFDGNSARARVNVESCYKLLELIELAELHGFLFVTSNDYPQNKNRDYVFRFPFAPSVHMSFSLEAYFTSATCRKKQIGTTPVYEMSCNMDEAPTPTPTLEEPEDDIPF